MESKIRDVHEIIREEMFMRDKILTLLKEGPKTIPEIAKALGRPSNEVMYWVMAARKYGYVEEGTEVSDEGFYFYSLAAAEEG